MNSSKDTPSYINKKVFIKKLQGPAEYPFPSADGAIAYNVTLIARTDSRSEDNHMEVNTFHTGLVVTALPKDAYLEIIPHPNLYKSGYMLPGPIIIDDSCKGEVIIPLYKFKDMECLDLPFPAVQFIVKSHVPVHISSDEIKKPKDEFASYGGQLPTVMYQAESSYKGASRVKSGKAKGNHMF